MRWRAHPLHGVLEYGLGGAHELFTSGVGVLSPETGASTGTTVLAESRDVAHGLGFDAPSTFAHVGTLTLAQSDSVLVRGPVS